MPETLAAVIFDFDGVIVHSEPLHYRGFREAAESEHLVLTEQQYYEELIGFDDRGAIKRLFELNGRPFDAALALRLHAKKMDLVRELIFRRHYHALPGVEEFVRGLWRNYPLAICSGALREEIEGMLEGISLRDCFSVIVAAEDVDVGKPDPRGYHLARRLLGEKVGKELPANRCLVVEDAPTVIERVKAEGFRTLAVATTYTPDRLQMADHVVKSLHPDAVHAQLPRLKLYTDPELP
jgi:HAD superfamily hydrolase (TIGR01509 family)